MTKEILIKNFDDVKTLNFLASTYEDTIIIEDEHGSRADVKSLLGLMSLSYSTPVTLEVDSPSIAETIACILENKNDFYKAFEALKKSR